MKPSNPTYLSFATFIRNPKENLFTISSNNKAYVRGNISKNAEIPKIQRPQGQFQQQNFGLNNFILFLL